MLPILAIFESVTVRLSGENYVTGSSVIVLADFISFEMRKIFPQTPEGKAIYESFEYEIKGRLQFIEKSHILSHATILDPRYKKVFFANAFYASNGRFFGILI